MIQWNDFFLNLKYLVLISKAIQISTIYSRTQISVKFTVMTINLFFIKLLQVSYNSWDITWVITGKSLQMSYYRWVITGELLQACYSSKVIIVELLQVSYNTCVITEELLHMRFYRWVITGEL